MGIDGLVDGPHTALADLLDDPVMPKHLAGQSGMSHFSPSSVILLYVRPSRKVNPAGRRRRPAWARPAGGEFIGDSPLGGIAGLPGAIQNGGESGPFASPGVPP